MVLIRIYARFIRTRTAAIDGWLVIIAPFPATGLTVTVSLAAPAMDGICTFGTFSIRAKLHRS
jgi:hypothetical protein